MEMAYSTDARQMALNYHMNGHTLEETSKELGIGISTLTRWKRQFSETGNVEKAPLERQPRKFLDDELRSYVQEKPFATLKEIAKEFGGSKTGAFKALKRLNITLKRGLLRTQNETRKSGRNSVSSSFR
jgi:transposase